MTYEEIVEAMAEAIWISPSLAWSEIGEITRDSVRKEARAAISALRALAEAGGYRLMVPMQATMQMELEWEDDNRPLTAAGDWSVMLSAAPDPTQEPK